MPSAINRAPGGIENERMNPSNPASLQNLNDIVMPASVGWWPLAGGWYVLAAVVLILLTWFIIKSVRDWKANAYRRAALLELKSLVDNAGDEGSRAAGLRKLPALLKRTALSVYPREDVAGLTGDDWFRFLNSKVSKPSFSPQAFDLLNRVAYTTGNLGDIGDDAVKSLVDACESWLEHHSNKPSSRQPGGS